MKFSLSLSLRTATIALAFAGAAPVFAASDYLLEIEDYAGPGKPGTIEVQSWSWGASNPTSVGSSGMSAGRQATGGAPLAQPLLRNGSLRVVTAREAGSGMATGRCAVQKHWHAANFRGPRQTISLTDLVVTACAADGMTISYGSAHPAPAAPAASTVVKSKSNITNN
jgi:hypothetical protein